MEPKKIPQFKRQKPVNHIYTKHLNNTAVPTNIHSHHLPNHFSRRQRILPRPPPLLRPTPVRRSRGHRSRRPSHPCPHRRRLFTILRRHGHPIRQRRSRLSRRRRRRRRGLRCRHCCRLFLMWTEVTRYKSHGEEAPAAIIRILAGDQRRQRRNRHAVEGSIAILAP